MTRGKETEETAKFLCIYLVKLGDFVDVKTLRKDKRRYI
jgi:hypothetical protein